MSSLIYIAVVLKHKMSFSSSISILFLHLSPLHFFLLITLLAGLPIIYYSTHYSACFNIYNKILTPKHLISKPQAGKQRDKKKEENSILVSQTFCNYSEEKGSSKWGKEEIQVLSVQEIQVSSRATSGKWCENFISISCVYIELISS